MVSIYAAYFFFRQQPCTRVMILRNTYNIKEVRVHYNIYKYIDSLILIEYSIILNIQYYHSNIIYVYL